MIKELIYLIVAVVAACTAYPSDLITEEHDGRGLDVAESANPFFKSLFGGFRSGGYGGGSGYGNGNGYGNGYATGYGGYGGGGYDGGYGGYRVLGQQGYGGGYGAGYGGFKGGWRG